VAEESAKGIWRDGLHDAAFSLQGIAS